MFRAKIILAITAVFVLLSCQQEPDVTATPTGPNIVLIMADDMGYSDPGFMGSEIHTPHLDSLAANGLVLTNFYNNARCGPTRASLLTGLYAHQTGMGDMLIDLGYPAYRGFLNNKCITLAEILQEAGYSTYISGKWHLGQEPEHRPLARGFDHFYGYLKGGIYYWPFQRPRKIFRDEEEIEINKEEFYSTDEISDHAVRFLKEHSATRKNPFFLYVPHIAPHFPLQAPSEVIAKYRGKYLAGFDSIRNRRYRNLLKRGIIDSTVSLSPPDERVGGWEKLSPAQKDTFDLRMAVYAAQMEVMDEGIGRIVGQLRQSEELENTVIIYLSDNGASAAEILGDNSGEVPIGGPGSFTSYLPSWANVSNTPFRMYKHWAEEGGIITPLVVHYPKKVAVGMDHQPAHIMDVVPTILELADIPYPKTFNGNEIMPLEGRSMVPILKGESREMQDFLFWEHQGNAAVRHNKWKAVLRYPETDWQLYDLEADRTENKDLALEEPDTLALLINKYNKWADRVGVQPWAELSSDRLNTNYE